MCECAHVHTCLQERERENEGESGKKIGTEPESFFSPIKVIIVSLEIRGLY